MNQISLIQMNNYCLQLINNYYSYYQELKEAFQVLYLTGCRVSEIFDIRRWSHVSGSVFRVQPQKGNYTRDIDFGSNCLNFQSAIIGQYAPFIGRTNSNLQQFFDQNKIFGDLYSGSKRISLYLFRYRFIKNLQNEGYSLVEIATKMGYTSTDTPLAYLSAIIYEDVSLPPPSLTRIGNLEISANNLSVNDGLNGIFGSINEDTWWSGFYYNNEAAIRVAGLCDGFRIPSKSDMDDILKFAGGGAKNGEKFRFNSSVYWSGNFPLASNFCNVNFKGAGYVFNGNIIQKKERLKIRLQPVVEGRFYAMTMDLFGQGIYLTSGTTDTFDSVRLVRGSVF